MKTMENLLLFARPSREAELAKQGWTKRFSASGSRLEETAEFYKATGFEVHLEPARAEDFACPECHPQSPASTIEGYYVIYTRPQRGAGGGPTPDDELW
ncbi:MAG: hypothetical protein A3F90_09980 [Deltaproteobacteria bacterium RIFCSPLOWO2_12_FULL_60_19]|nr:MAG: hypothetical protein A3F90_09980 [Deltaproteobacteria bacterium RIFCSPLOWO2_12_FULL_60_19]